MKTSGAGLRFALIGADTLLIECGRTTLERGHEIVSVAAGSDRVADWAAKAAIPVHEFATWADVLRKQSVEYIFAITHLQLLPAPVISAARRMAINFHDGPLPEYAGLNTPVWGILRGETEWGVSWHRIDEGVDTGEVLVQRRFAIAERETSLSLNTRNFEEALDSFGDVLDLLEADDLKFVPRDASATRTLFRRADRPDGILNFDQTATEVDRVVRALHFGPHPNPVAAAVLWHPEAAVIIGSSESTDTRPGGAAGKLLAANNDGLTVACSVGVVQLGDLSWLDGTRCSALDFLRATGVNVGDLLPALTDQQRDWFEQFTTNTERREATTIADLSALTPAEFPWPHTTTRAEPRKPATVKLPLDGACTATQLVGALAELLARLSPDGGLDVALAQEPAPEFARSLICTEAVLNLKLSSDNTASWRRDLVARTPRLSGRTELNGGLSLPIGLRRSRDDATVPGASVVLQPSADDGWEVEFDPEAVDTGSTTEFARCIAVIADALRSGSVSPAEVSLLSAEDHDRVVHQWNATDAPYDSACIHDLINTQAAVAPHREAVVCGDEVVTYRDLLERSYRLATHLQQVGVGPDTLVGVHVDRSIDLVVAVLGVLQAGGAYVPLDPAYPADRLRHMIQDSGTRVIVCQERHRARLPLPVDGTERQVVAVDGDLKRPVPLKHPVQPNNLAYCIYTSGSAGVPKGVLVEHRNVANLFSAMDAVIPRGENKTWLAVTSLSFDISVLELLYTLARGIRVALYVPDVLQATTPRKSMDFSLFYFSADEAAETGRAKGSGKYRLLLDGARFADANGFCAVWTPERHFHAFGGLYPNPAVTAAAIATITERIAIRAGSVVLPLHHPVEVAEAWSMVDNLSNGRVGVAFASGWQPNDFVLRPQNYTRAKATMFEGIEQIRRLWRGETLSFEGPDNMNVDVATLPRPVQAELPMWITTAGYHDSFAAAGAIGANVLTHLVGQSVDQLAPKIAAYREARAAAGHDPATGVVTLMLHTFIGDDAATVRAAVREPLRAYLKSSFSLLREHAWAFPTFRRPDGAPIGDASDLADNDLANLADKDLEAVLDFAAERYYESSGLFGTPEQVLPLVEKLHRVGVDEIACLVDFGVDTDAVLAHLPHLARVRELVTAQTAVEPIANDTSIADLLVASATTHLQCTPSMARMFTLDPAMRTALGKVQHLFVGGEALPIDLAGELHLLVGGTVTNMYGPTETTVWSSTWPLQEGFDWIPIGTPIANTQLYVLDRVGHPTPPGVTGQLWIGGEGVARGYHERPELTAERFRRDPFRENGRMYCTGDLARWHAQPDGGGILEFLGRGDQQVKLRGHRIELGEIEAELRRVADVVDCAAVVRERADDHFDQQLVAYVVTTNPAFDPNAVREMLRTRLPEVMVPSHIVALPALPRTPNGKLDRRALPARVATPASVPSPATSDVEHQVLADWQQVLGTRDIGVDDNFFDAGGHSLLVVRLHRALQQTLGRNIALTDVYRFPTVRSFAGSLAGSRESSPAIDTALERAARRKATSLGKSGRGKSGQGKP